MRVWIVRGIAFGLVLCCLGCGKASDRKPVYPVVDKIVINKKPIKGVVVSFHPKDELDNPRALRSFTTTDEEGTFHLTTYLTNDGAPAGEYVVTLYWPGKVPPNSPIGEVGPDRLRGKYANPKTSTLRATIQKQPNDLGDIAVTIP